MTRLNKGASPKGGTYFVCSDASRAVSCANTRKWRADEIEQKVIGSLYTADVEKILEPPAPDQSSASEGLRARIAAAERQRDRWAKAFDDGDDYAADRIKALRDQIKRLKEELAQASREEVEQASAEPAGTLLVRARDIAQRLSQSTDEEAADLRRKLSQAIREVFLEVRCHPEHVQAIVKRRWRRPLKGTSVVPPPFRDGKPMAEWEVPITLIDERPLTPAQVEEFQWLSEIEEHRSDSEWPQVFRKRPA
jgi:hypothetical protein